MRFVGCGKSAIGQGPGVTIARAAALGLLLVVGCSSKVWIRPGTTKYQFAQDRSHCIEESAIPGAPAPAQGEKPVVDEEIFANCMRGLGYEQVSETSVMFR